MTGMEIPDVAAPLVGYKILTLKNDGDGNHEELLRSEHDEGVWPVEGRTARCDAFQQAPCHPSNVRSWSSFPTSSFGAPKYSRTYHYAYPCGIYAFKDLEQAVQTLSSLDVQPRLMAVYQATPVLVRVLLWGKVWEHEKGYRAEHARIDGIGYAVVENPTTDKGFIFPEVAVRLARTYDVPMVNMTDLVRARIKREQELARLTGAKTRQEIYDWIYGATPPSAHPRVYGYRTVLAAAAVQQREARRRMWMTVTVRLGVAAFVLSVSLAALAAVAH